MFTKISSISTNKTETVTVMPKPVKWLKTLKFLLFLGIYSQCAADVIKTLDMLNDVERQGTVWAIFWLIGVLSLMVSGILVMLTQRLLRNLMIILIILWSITVFITIKDFFYNACSLKYFYGSITPATFFISILILVGFVDELWHFLNRILLPIMFMMVILLIYASCSYNYLLFQDRGLFIGRIGLIIPVIVFLLGYYILNKKMTLLMFSILFFFSIFFLWTGIRSWMLHVVLIFLLFMIQKVFSSRNSTFSFVVLVIFTSILATILFKGIIDNDAFDILKNRFYDDTRSGEYVDFFQSIDVNKMLTIGYGFSGTWSRGEMIRNGVDGAAITVTFWGGIGLITFYVLSVLWPLLGLFRRKTSWLFRDNMCYYVPLMSWVLVLSGVSVFAGVYAHLYQTLIYLFAGRCWYLNYYPVIELKTKD